MICIIVRPTPATGRRAEPPGHPDTMWWDCTLGNVKMRPFGAIWKDTRHAIMAGLKARPRKVKGRCVYLDV